MPTKKEKEREKAKTLFEKYGMGVVLKKKKFKGDPKQPVKPNYDPKRLNRTIAFKPNISPTEALKGKVITHEERR